MKTKIFATTVLAITIASSSFSQIKLGVQAGVNSSSATIKGLSDVNSITAPKVGLITEFNLMQGLLFRPAINFEQFGNEQSLTNIIPGSTITTATTTKISALEIPLELTVPVKIGKGKLLLSAAPTATIALSGNTTGTTTTTATGGSVATTNINNSIKFGNATAELKQIDWGTRFGLGYAFNNGIQLNTTYNLGVTNLSNVSGVSQKTHNIGITLAYFFIK
jgi:Outer membrane protein beta-barrel domain